MKEITVLGAGTAGAAFIERIRQKDIGVKITLIDKKRYCFNTKDGINALPPRQWRDLEQWSKDHNVDYINDRLDSVSVKRRKIYLKDAGIKEFQTLVIAAGLSSRKLELKGDHRDGFYYICDIDPVALKDILKISREVFVFVSTVIGLRLALGLKSLGKEVVVAGDNWDFLESRKDVFLNMFKQREIPVYLGVSIDEAIGEGIVKAVKITPLKVFSAQAVFIDSGFIPNRRFLEEELFVKQGFCTECEDVYLIGDVNNPGCETDFFFQNNYQEAIDQGRLCADFITDGKVCDFSRKVLSPEGKYTIIEDILNEARTYGGSEAYEHKSDG